MRKLSLIFVSLLILSSQIIYGQNKIIVNPKSSTITVKKIKDSELLIPIELEFLNNTTSTSNPAIKLQIDNSTSPPFSQFSSTDIVKVKLLNESQTFSMNSNETKKAPNTFYLFIDQSVLINADKIIYIDVKDGTIQLGLIKVTIQPDDKTLTLDEYLEDQNHSKSKTYQLDNVTKVESNNNTLSISGYKKISVNDVTQDVFLKKNVELKRGEVLAISDISCVFNPFHWKPIPLSLTTTPFKVRPKIESNTKHFNTTASSGISNIGFNLDLIKYQMDRYFVNGKKSTHKFSLGVLAAPSVEELDSIYTNGALGKATGKTEKSKQLFISTGIALSYTYNDISFAFVPFGWDYGTSTIGKEWIYNQKRWWGFGIGISPRIFSTILNK